MIYLVGQKVHWGFLYDVMGCVCVCVCVCVCACACVYIYKFRLIFDYPDEWKKKIWYIYAMEYS